MTNGVKISHENWREKKKLWLKKKEERQRNCCPNTMGDDQKFLSQNGNQLFCIIQSWMHCSVSESVFMWLQKRNQQQQMAEQNKKTFLFRLRHCAVHLASRLCGLVLLLSLTFLHFTFHSWCQTRALQNTHRCISKTICLFWFCHCQNRCPIIM